MRTRTNPCGLVLVGLLVAALLLVFLVEGCTTTPRSTDTPGTAVTSGAIKPYGSLKVGLDFVIGSMTPPSGVSLRTSTTFHILGAPAFDSLVELTSEGQPRPGLAERWEISPDGKTHTFYIRKGVKFHDGSDLTGADVKFTVDSYVAPENIDPDAGVWRAAIGSVELKDDYTVVYHLKEPQFELLKGFTTLSGAAAVLPKKYIEEKGFDYFVRNPIGSGPFKVTSFVPNIRLELEAVESHWRAVPKFKNVTLLNVQEESTKVAMLKTGELDIAADMSPDSVSGLKAAGLRVLSHPGGAGTFGYIFYDLDNPQQYALGDVRVRKALSLALNRQETADKMYGGYGQPMAVWNAPREAFFFDPNVLKPDPYDPEGAKKLLAEAGYANGFNTRLWDIGRGVGELVQALSGYWRRVGVAAELVPIEWSTLQKKWAPKQTPDVWNSVAVIRGSGGAMAFEKMVSSYHSTKSSPKNVRNPRLDELIDKVPQTLDPAEKKKLALEAAVLAKEGYSSLTIIHMDTLFAIGPKVGDLKPIKAIASLGPALETISHAK